MNALSKRRNLINQMTGFQPSRACRSDRRFSYSMYVPANWSESTASSFRFLVAMHGTARAAESTRDMYIDLADDTQCIVLAPLFPMAITEKEENHNYFWLKFEEIRYDQILLDMLEEASLKYGVSAEKFALTGFSGGGQFGHRMLYLHPERLSAVSIGAPGMVTLIDNSQDWFVGTRDFSQQFGKALDMEAIRKVAVHIVVGSEDMHPEIFVAPGTEMYMPGINDTGANRVERARTLQRHYTDLGIASELDIVPGAMHLSKEVLTAVDAFFRRSFG